MSKLFQLSTKYKTFCCGGLGLFLKRKPFFFTRNSVFLSKNAPIWKLNVFSAIESLYFWPAKNEDPGPFSVLILNTSLQEAEHTASEDCSLGVKGKMGIPGIRSDAGAAALPGCRLLTIFPCGCVGKRRGEAEGARHAGAGAVQAAAEV